MLITISDYILKGKDFVKKRNSGFTLIELVVVIAVLGIIAAIAAPRYVGYSEIAEKEVCVANRNMVARHYEVFLQGEMQGNVNFEQFVKENYNKVCSIDGVITFEDGKVKCSVHKEESDGNNEEPPGDEVPWL